MTSVAEASRKLLIASVMHRMSSYGVSRVKSLLRKGKRPKRRASNLLVALILTPPSVPEAVLERSEELVEIVAEVTGDSDRADGIIVGAAFHELEDYSQDEKGDAREAADAVFGVDPLFEGPSGEEAAVERGDEIEAEIAEAIENSEFGERIDGQKFAEIVDSESTAGIISEDVVSEFDQTNEDLDYVDDVTELDEDLGAIQSRWLAAGVDPDLITAGLANGIGLTPDYVVALGTELYQTSANNGHRERRI